MLEGLSAAEEATVLRQLDPGSPLLREALAGRYRIEGQLAEGGMAVVYLAEDTKLHRRVAVKILKRELSSDLGLKRFLREIEITSHLTHPNLLSLHDAGEMGGQLFFVMPYVEGVTLHARLRRDGPLPVDEALRIACDVAAGLGHAHRHGVVHRDIKPDNIILHEGRAVLLDFGIARAIHASPRDPRTSSGIIIGTAAYMSPEQASGKRAIDAPSDVYALACVLYEMLAGEPPFRGRSMQIVMSRHVHEPPPSVRIVRPEVPVVIEQVIMRALAKDPAARPPDGDAFVEALEACRSDTTPGAIAVPPHSRELPRHRWRYVIIAAVLGLTLLAGALALGRCAVASAAVSAAPVLPAGA